MWSPQFSGGVILCVPSITSNIQLFGYHVDSNTITSLLGYGFDQILWYLSWSGHRFKPDFRKPEKLLEGENANVSGPRTVAYSRANGKWSILRVFSLRRSRSLLSQERQLKVPLVDWIGSPCFCPSLIFCCICNIRLLSLACCFVLSYLKNAGRSTRD